MTENTLTPHDREYAIRLAECFPDDLGYSEHHRLAHYVRRYEAALIASEKRREELEAVLRFYANEDNYWLKDDGDDISDIQFDEGMRAREVLG